MRKRHLRHKAPPRRAGAPAIHRTRLLLTVDGGMVTASEVVAPAQWVIYQMIQRGEARLVNPSSVDSILRFVEREVPPEALPAIAALCAARLAANYGFVGIKKPETAP